MHLEERSTGGRRRAIGVALAFAACGAAFVLHVTAPWGPGASSDSVTYLSTAQSLAAGKGLFRFDGAAYAAWPPLYPALLAALIEMGLSPSDAARVFQALVMAVSLAALIGILRQLTGSLAWAAVGGVLFFGSPRVLITYATVWSEGLLLAWVALAVWGVSRSGPAPRERQALLLGLVCGGAILSRYLGVALAAAVFLWLATARGDARARARRLAVFSLATAIGPAAWIARNLIVAGTASGKRGAGYAIFTTNVAQFFENTAGYLNAGSLETWGPLLGALAFVGVPLAALAWCAHAWRRPGPPPAALLVTAVYALLYVGLLIGIASWTPVARLARTRFVTPVWIPLLILGVTGAAAAWRRWPRLPPRLVLAAALALFGWHGLEASSRQASNMRERGVHGVGRATWHRSELMEALRKAYNGQTLLTNRPHAVFWHTSMPVRYGPRKHAYRSTRARTRDLELLREQAVRQGSVPLAWFWDYQGGYGYYNPQQLAAAGICLKVADGRKDGVLFRVMPDDSCQRSAKQPAPAAP